LDLIGDPNHEAELNALLKKAQEVAPGAPGVPLTPRAAWTGPTEKIQSVDPTTGLPIPGFFEDAPVTKPTTYAEDMKGVGRSLQQVAAGVPIAGALVPRDEAYEKDYPGLTTALRGVGSVASMSAALKAFPVLGEAFGMGDGPALLRTIKGAFGGGALNTADAAARGEDKTSAAVIGTALGGLVPALGTAIGSAARGIRNWSAPIPPELQNVGPLARKWLSEGMAGETRQSVAASQQRVGPAGFVADLTPGLTDKAAGIVSARGAPANDIEAAYRGRDVGDRGRIDQAINDAIGPPPDLAAITRDAKVARAAGSDPLYDAWTNTPVPPTPQLDALMPRLQAAGVDKEAQRLMAMEGIPGHQNWFTQNPGGSPAFNTQSSPTAQAWDYMKQGLDAKISEATLRGNDNAKRILTGMKSDLVNAIDNHPDPNVAGVWKQARQSWADPTSIMTAQDNGYKAFTNARVDEMRQALPAMTPPERQAYMQGARGALADQMNGSISGDTAVRNKLRAPANVEKVALMTGDPQKAQTLLDTMEQEAEMKGRTQQVIGNPQTGASGATRSQQLAGVTPDPNTGLVGYLRNVQAGQPSTWIPGFTPAAVAHASREPFYSAARSQAAPVLLRSGADQQATANALLNYSQQRGLSGQMANDINRRLIQMLGTPGAGLPVAKKYYQQNPEDIVQ
jgi:hypothetical protein